MSSERCDLLREGFLDVKFPPDSPERVLHKAWRKLWIRAHVLQPMKREPSLILHIGRGSQDQHFQSLKVSRDGLRLFRCRSGSRPLQTWALSSGTSLIVYLAAENEEDTQSWMETLREGLWPSILNIKEKSHDVSLIDDEKTFLAGILGLYGRLVKTSDGMVSIIHPHWQGILLRWKQEDVVNIQLVRKVGDETSTAGVFKITFKSSKIETRTFYFYSNTAISAINWLRSSKNESKELLIDKKLQNTNKPSHPSVSQDENKESSDNASVYARIETDSRQLDSVQENKQVIDQNMDKLQSGHLLATNISSEFLDASLNFTKLPQTDTKLKEDVSSSTCDVVSEDESSDMYDHVYEDMMPKESRSYTVYDEVQELESDYVPPLPPTLPREKPRILRLLKLSESVAEALKLVEEPTVVDKGPTCLRDTPVKETTPRVLNKNTIARIS